jgi:hypothetical protein
VLSGHQLLNEERDTVASGHDSIDQIGRHGHGPETLAERYFGLCRVECVHAHGRQSSTSF